MNRCAAGILAALLTGVVGYTQSAPARVALGDFFKPGVVFQDRNNDGVVDFVNARLVLAPQSAAGDLAAAADIAARLGFETSAIDLPLGKANGETPTIFVGVKSLAESGTTVDALAAGAPLKAGDGLIAAFSTAGQPALAVLGGDDGGVAAAALMLAGHLPFVWDQKGPTTDKVADEVKEFLGTKGIPATAAIATAAFVRANTDGAERLVVDLQLASGDVIKAQVALNQMVAIGGRDAKRPLSYVNIRTLRVRLRGAGIAVSTSIFREPSPPQLPTSTRRRRPAVQAAAQRKTSISRRSTPSTVRWPTRTTT